MDAGYTAATRVADPLLGKVPVNTTNGRHGGCRLRFDITGAPMVSTGDSATETVPQDLTSLGGKILRINPRTGGPAAGNPRINAANPNTRLIWSYGHRNPQGLALRPNGQMFTVEHGSSETTRSTASCATATTGGTPTVPGAVMTSRYR